MKATKGPVTVPTVALIRWSMVMAASWAAAANGKSRARSAASAGA